MEPHLGGEPEGVRVIVALGSNVEPRADYLARARAALAAFPGTWLERASAVIETTPVDVPPEYADLAFLNQVLVLWTTLEPYDFSRRMHAGAKTFSVHRTTTPAGPWPGSWAPKDRACRRRHLTSRIGAFTYRLKRPAKASMWPQRPPSASLICAAAD